MIMRDYRDDLGLLKHELGDQNRIGITGRAPRQVAAMAAKPVEKRTAKRADVLN